MNFKTFTHIHLPFERGQLEAFNMVAEFKYQILNYDIETVC